MPAEALPIHTTPVNNDSVNWIDLWGLSTSDVTAYKIPIAEIGGILVAGANVELTVVFDTANNWGYTKLIEFIDGDRKK